ncbi:hypothetical protein LZ30DRAFT_28261 [Colletotrichum cereale]|nr:hypothetical protein LZ30DRAFT_28261 [Colletotrichum cereale]
MSEVSTLWQVEVPSYVLLSGRDKRGAEVVRAVSPAACEATGRLPRPESEIAEDAAGGADTGLMGPDEGRHGSVTRQSGAGGGPRPRSAGRGCGAAGHSQTEKQKNWVPAWRAGGTTLALSRFHSLLTLGSNETARSGFKALHGRKRGVLYGYSRPSNG